MKSRKREIQEQTYAARNLIYTTERGMLHCRINPLPRDVHGDDPTSSTTAQWSIYFIREIKRVSREPRPTDFNVATMKFIRVADLRTIFKIAFIETEINKIFIRALWELFTVLCAAAWVVSDCGKNIFPYDVGMGAIVQALHTLNICLC